MTAPVIGNFAFKYGDNGYEINANNTIAPYLDIHSVVGLDNATYKTVTKEYDGQDGGTFSGEFESMRKIVISGEIIGGDVNSAPIEPLLDILKANFAPTPRPVPLYFQPAGVPLRQIFCKSEGFHYSWEAMRRWNSSAFTITLTAEDPTIYSATLQRVQGILLRSAPGYTFNHGFDYSFGGMGSVSTPLLINGGNKPVGFIARWSGQAVANPRLLSATTSQVLSLNLSISTGDELVVDFYNQRVLFNGSSRRKAVANEGWFDLQPGANSVTYQADSANDSVVNFEFWDGFR
jgi:hypothetical protein